MKKLTAVLAGATLMASGVSLAAGSITGTIAYTGSPVKAEPLKRKSDPVCAKKAFNDETVTLSKDGKALQNVVVRVTKGAAAGAVAPGGPVIVDQIECMYRPRVQVAVEGQKIQIKNSDGTLHNVHTYAGTKTLFNQAQPPKAAPIEKPLTGGEVIKLKCDVHPWMTGYVVVSKNPFFAVTGEDGKFTLKDVPPGTYTVEAWHEKLGTQTAEVTVADNAAAEAKMGFGDKK